MDLHAQIMNLPVKPGLATANATDNQMVFYKLGHRDARHAAAELASAQSERIARLEEALREAQPALLILRDLADNTGINDHLRGLPALIERVASALEQQCTE